MTRLGMLQTIRVRYHQGSRVGHDQKLTSVCSVPSALFGGWSRFRLSVAKIYPKSKYSFIAIPVLSDSIAESNHEPSRMRLDLQPVTSLCPRLLMALFFGLLPLISQATAVDLATQTITIALTQEPPNLDSVRTTDTVQRNPFAPP